MHPLPDRHSLPDGGPLLGEIYMSRRSPRPSNMAADDDFVQLKDDAEYPYLHVHTQDGDDVDPVTR